MKPFPPFGEKQNKIEGNNVKHELKSEESKGVQSEEKDIKQLSTQMNQNHKMTAATTTSSTSTTAHHQHHDASSDTNATTTATSSNLPQNTDNTTTSPTMTSTNPDNHHPQ